MILDEQEAGLTIAERVLRWHHVDEEELEGNIEAIRLSMPPGEEQ